MATEDLEQLKVLECGYRMRVARVSHVSFGLDEPSDVPRILEAMQQVLHAQKPHERG